MPPKTNSTTARKRKKTEDMAESPPKRVTRAKAAKSNADINEGPKTTRITTASARIAAEAKAASSSKAAPKTTRSTKRKTRAEDKAEDVQVGSDVGEQGKPGPTKTRGRSKKIESAGEEKASKTTKTKTRQPRAETEEAETTVAEKPKTRATRSRTTKEDKLAIGDREAQSEAKPTKRSTRSRTGTITSEPEKPPLTKTKTTKKVTFQDDVSQDKENVTTTQGNTKKSTTKETGLKAKPVRRPAQTGATTRTIAGNTKARKISKPLSPKKIVQIAKSSSISSEDELGKSPIKQPTKPSRATPEKKPVMQNEMGINDTKSRIVNSPTSPQVQTLLASPPKKPPGSPFKDSIKESPKKFPMVSPRKALGEVPALQLQFKDSMKRSPKRLGFTPSQSQSQENLNFKAPTFGRSGFLDTPARRPNSPLKIGSLKVPGRTGGPMPITNTTSALRHMKSSSLLSATPRRLFGTPLKACKSIRSPAKVSLAEPEPAPTEQEASSQDPAEPIEEATERAVADVEEQKQVSPLGAPQFLAHDVFSDTPKAFRSMIDDDSEDELLSGTPTMRSPVKNALLAAQGFTPAPKPIATEAITSPEQAYQQSRAVASIEDISMTPLAFQMSKWFAASPPRDEETEEEQLNDVFLPVGAVLRRNSANISHRQTMTPPGNPTFFEEQLEARQPSPSPSPQEALPEQDLHMAETVDSAEQEGRVQQSQESEQYGDENVLPQEQAVLEMEVDTTLQVTENAYVTPAKVFYNQPNVVHTVSKIPLKGAAEHSPSDLKLPKKRSKSLAGPLVELNVSEDPLFSQDMSEMSKGGAVLGGDPEVSEASNKIATPKSAGKLSRDARTLSIELASIAGSPTKSVRKGADAQILRGAVVHVDVHTTEGADASGIFVELLTSMGAKCIKQWTWNPRASIVAGEDPAASSKVGITHVVFKDGSKRTLQKVREAKGLVLCVGVGWVLE